MDVKEAVQTAKEYLADLFVDEDLSDIGLEEVRYDYDDDKWHVTVGFSRPWDRKHPIAAIRGEPNPRRSYKVICINDESGNVESLKDRILERPRPV